VRSPPPTAGWLTISFLSIRSIDNRYRHRIVIASILNDDRSPDGSPDRGPTEVPDESPDRDRESRVARLISKGVPGVVRDNKNAKLSSTKVIDY
jgi:hypothetical protein